MPKRLAFVVPQLSLGGAERQLVRTAKALVSAGTDVLLVSTSELGGGLEAEDGAPGVNVVHLDRRKSAPRRWLELRGAIKGYAPDCVIAWLPSSWLWVEAVRFPSRRPPVVVAERNSVQNDDWKFTALKYLAARRANRLVANSTPAAECWRRRLRRIPVLTSVNFPPQGTARPIRFPSGSRVRLAVIGRLQPQKGIDVAIRGVAGAFRAGADVRLDIVGDGPAGDRERLERLADREGIASRVRFRGRMGRPLEQLSSDIDVVLLTSRWEGTSNVLAEALHQGFPVIATTAYEVPVPGITFTRLCPGNPTLLAEAILTGAWNQTHVDASAWSVWAREARAHALSLWSVSGTLAN